MRRLPLFLTILAALVFVFSIRTASTADAQGSCFPETGFCVTNPAFAEYFRIRGGIRILGYPVSRSFTLDGFEVQFFQRVVLQLQSGSVQRLNVLDPNIMPMTRANQSVFPKPDPSLAANAPQVGAPDYPRRVVDFVRQVAPDAWNGQPVGYFTLFNTTVPVAIAFPGAAPNPDLVTLLNLEIWGLPTSRPAPDPGNGGFIYQRFQRGIMHFRAEVPVTEGILVGEYLKSVMTAQNLPPDLAEDMRGSRYLGQYRPGAAGWLARPADLPSTDLTAAFEKGTGPVTGPPAPATATPAPTATATAAPSGPSAAIYVDDALIDSGQALAITVIARDVEPLDNLQLHPVLGDERPDGDHSPATDPELAVRSVACDGRLDCAFVWNVVPTTEGRYTLWARAQRQSGVLSDWVGTGLRIRPANTPTPTLIPTATLTATPTFTPTATATATFPPTAMATAAATTPPVGQGASTGVPGAARTPSP